MVRERNSSFVFSFQFFGVVKRNYEYGNLSLRSVKTMLLLFWRKWSPRPPGVHVSWTSRLRSLRSDFFHSLGCVAGVRRGRERGFWSAAKNVPRTRRSESARRLDFQRPCTELRGKASSTVLDGRESLFWRADILALWLKKTVARIESYQNYRQ